MIKNILDALAWSMQYERGPLMWALGLTVNVFLMVFVLLSLIGLFVVYPVSFPIVMGLSLWHIVHEYRKDEG